MESASQCPNPENGCPAATPFFCNYSATCVADSTLCANDTTAKAALDSICAANYTITQYGCPLGDCQVNETYCSTFTDPCLNWFYPNNIKSDASYGLNSTYCYIP